MNNKRTWIFRLIMMGIPIMFFLLLELILRVAGYGVSYPLFIDTPDSPNYILARPDIVKRYFPEQAEIPSVTMEANLFLKQKPANGLRLFVQGGSTAAGFPYGLGASPAGMLDQRLKQTFPQQHVEVINTALSAVNTFTVLDMVDEIIDQQPDAVLLYTGHNEYLGIMGVGSNYSAFGSYGANLMLLKVKELRTFQLLQNLYIGLQQLNRESLRTTDCLPEPGCVNERTFMSKVAKERNIAITSDMFQAGLSQFESNLSTIISKYQAARIPVYIATLASNIKDQKPFVSSAMTVASKVRLNNLMDLAATGTSGVQLIELAKEILSIDDNEQSADAHFMIGKALEVANQLRLAKPYFEKAKELDLLRFRAPEAFNGIIRQVAEEQGVYLVDYQANLAQRAPAGVIGKEFMLEHLHPNLPGYFILADSFYNALMNNTLKDTPGSKVSTDTAWNYRPVLPAEEYYGFAQIIQLKSDYPFTSEPEEFVLPKPTDWQQELGLKRFKREIDWLTMIGDSYRGYIDERNMPMLLKSAQIIADAMPHNHQANYEFGRLLVQDGRKSEARVYFKRALIEEPDNEIYSRAYASVMDEELTLNK